MRMRSNTPDLSPAQAHYVLQRLLRERTITGADIRNAITGMHREIGELEQKLAELRSSAATGPRAGKPARRRSAPLRTKGRRRKATISPQVMASRKIQGQYIGYMRQLPEKDRVRYAEMAKSKGREAAIVAMKKTLGK